MGKNSPSCPYAAILYFWRGAHGILQYMLNSKSAAKARTAVSRIINARKKNMCGKERHLLTLEKENKRNGKETDAAIFV